MSIREIRAGKTQRHNILRPRGELVAANARLEDFAYAMAHDLREPLRTISMFTELLLEDSDLKSGSKVQARFIMDGVARMSALLEGLHTFAQSGFDDAPRLFELGDTLAEVLKNLAHAIKTSGAAITAGPLPAVEGVERHLVRVFQNLIVNSIKYRSEAPVEIHVSAERLGPEWIIKFKDNGVGIDQDQHDRVFELFKRLHGHEAPGAGIGLAICKKIVEAMGGTIWIESNAGSGATFCFTIPVAEHAASSAAGNDEAVSARAPVPARRFFAPGLCRTTQGNCMTNRVNDTER